MHVMIRVLHSCLCAACDSSAYVNAGETTVQHIVVLCTPHKCVCSIIPKKQEAQNAIRLVTEN